MNTKTDQISSGLVAHIAAFKEALNGTRGDLDAWLECNDESDVRQAIFGVISEAEAKLSECVTSYEKEVAGLTAELDAKDVEIERLALYKNLADEYGLSVFADLKELEDDRDTWKARAEFSFIQRDKQSAALKLASLALSEGVEYVEEPPEKNCSCHLSPPCNDCVDHSAVREFIIDARKAIAAIDALEGE